MPIRTVYDNDHGAEQSSGCHTKEHTGFQVMKKLVNFRMFATDPFNFQPVRLRPCQLSPV